MLAPTHSVFGIFLTLIILAVFGVQWSLHWTIILFAILGAVMPDIDHPKSIIGKLFYFISAPIERRYGHRTITHSLIGLAIFTVIFAVIIGLISFLPQISAWGWTDLPIRWIAAFSISYFSHLVLDMFNRRGSQMFWPDPGRDVIPRNQRFRIKSGSRTEIIVFIVLLALMFLAFPISKYGPASTVRWLLATSGSAIEEFKTSDTVSYLEFKGYFKNTKQPVEGRAEILGVQNKRLIILLKDDGQIYTISDELASDILAEKMRVEKSNKPLKVEKREFKNEERGYLLSQVPDGARISGVINLPAGMNVTIPESPGFFKVFEQKGDDLHLNFANREMIEKLGLTEQFDLQKKKDMVELSGLVTRARKIRNEISEIQSKDGLTELGQTLLLGKDKIEKQNTRLAELRSQLADVNLKIEEVNLKIKSRKFVFSGSVYIRQRGGK
ncbi:MAG: metal-dependent hydrolase [Candidatus Margulisiibacteriota bacterium]|nr:metal-dependent hydrolase [Candidatus Margulisiibacteriota bacterium]